MQRFRDAYCIDNASASGYDERNEIGKGDAEYPLNEIKETK
jgi:hypothetical protein